MTAPTPPDLSVAIPRSWILEIPDAVSYRNFTVVEGEPGRFPHAMALPPGVCLIRFTWTGTASLIAIVNGKAFQHVNASTGRTVYELPVKPGWEMSVQAFNPASTDVGKQLGVSVYPTGLAT